MSLFSYKPNRSVLVSVTTSIFLLSILMYLFSTGNQLTARYAPQINAAIEIKLNGTLGHLWLEEILSGDETIDIKLVWENLSRSDSYALALLGDVHSLNDKIVPLNHHETRLAIQNARDDLGKFRAVAEKRFQNFSNSSPGTEIDQQFDWLFENFLNSADLAESMLRNYLADDLLSYRRTGFILLLISVVAAIFLTLYLYQQNKLREKYVAEIENANQEIEVKNKGLDYLAHFDLLTGLPNRVLFFDRLQQSLIHAERSQELVVLLFIDLDRFKNANDRLGHHNGDVLLTNVAERLKNTVRAEDTVSRLGGDEFTIILAGFHTLKQAISVTNAISKSIIEVTGQVYNIDSREAHVTSSIGIAIYPKDGTTAEKLLVNADMAMYHAKENGRNNFQYHSEELNTKSQVRLQLEIDLRNAINRNEFFLDYQTQWNLSSGKLSGMEALLRWDHPEKGVIHPDEFIPCCEDCGLMDKIEDWVFDTALKQYARWKENDLEPDRLSLNISLVHFQNRDLLDTLVRTLTRYNLSPNILELELTESVLMENTEVTHDKLRQLKNLGIHLAIDDFGTGYSSMSYLLNFPIDTLKIDRTFVSRMHTDDSAGPIISNIIFLANSLNLEVVAEGVETKQQIKFLNKYGCQYGQGFLLGKPVDKDQMTLLLIEQAENNIAILNTPRGSGSLKH